MVIYTPLGPGPYPTLVFHHGSTGSGDNPSLFGLPYESEALAFFLVERAPDRSRYSCLAEAALAGLDRALEDANVVTGFALGMTEVDPDRMLLGGRSRGGILATAHARRRPAVYAGVINFVGGWLGEGCADAVTVNRSTFEEAADQPSPVLWLYGENDPFYSVSHSRGNYDAFAAAGGSGAFRLYRRGDPAASGHLILNEPSLWQADVDLLLSTVFQ
jgi:dienelactone hydrolase